MSLPQNNKKSQAQIDRQWRRNRNGKYQKFPCDGCRKGAPMDYFSHPLTDTIDADGEHWADVALVLCKKCADATYDLKTVKEFRAYQESKIKKSGNK